MKIENLHSHTTTSDGKQTYFEALETAMEVGIEIMAFTDHDSTIPIDTFEQLKGYASKTKFISGIEISSRLPKELGSENHDKFHIVGLFVDPTNVELTSYCQKASNERLGRAKRVIDNLRHLGFNISFDEVISIFHGAALGYPHIVETLLSKKENIKILDKIREQMKIDSEHNPDIDLKYQKMMASGPKQYPYSLVISKNAYISGVYQSTSFQTDMDESVRLIRQAGGVAILAHYYTVSDKINLSLVETLINGGRLDGVETIFGLFSFVDRHPEHYAIELNAMSEIVSQTRCIKGGGADSHSRQDLIDYAKTTSLSENSVGMAESIIKERGTSNWSTY